MVTLKIYTYMCNTYVIHTYVGSLWPGTKWHKNPATNITPSKFMVGVFGNCYIAELGRLLDKLNFC